MSGCKCLQAVLLIFVAILTGQIPAQSQEAAIVGLKGHVQSVLTEEYTSEDGLNKEPSGSTLDVYDPAGYELEFFRYKPDGSLWVHAVYARNGSQLFEVQVTGTAPFESNSTQYVFDSEGHVVETDNYDAKGVLVSKTTNELLQKQDDSTTYRVRQSSADGSESLGEVTETADPKTGITHQIETEDGRPKTDWVIQQNKDGTGNDKIVYADGSYNERERKSDGTTVEDSYYAPTKGHTYQKTDAQGHLVEVTGKSDSQYIRCTYSFDKEGRSTGQINYDASGNILEKTTAEYRDDARGNWIEKESIVWDTKTEPTQPKLAAFTLRTINYY